MHKIHLDNTSGNRKPFKELATPDWYFPSMVTTDINFLSPKVEEIQKYRRFAESSIKWHLLHFQVQEGLETRSYFHTWSSTCINTPSNFIKYAVSCFRDKSKTSAFTELRVLFNYKKINTLQLLVKQKLGRAQCRQARQKISTQRKPGLNQGVRFQQRTSERTEQLPRLTHRTDF